MQAWRLKSLVMVFFWFLGISLEAKTHNIEHPLSPQISHIRIQLKKGNVRLIPQKSQKVSIQSEKPIEITKESIQKANKNTLVISEEEFFSFSEGQTFNITGQQNKVRIKVPIDKPITLVLFQGVVGVVGVESVAKVGSFNNLSIMMAGRGTIRTKNTKGMLLVSQRAGDVHIHSHKGKLVVQGERSHVRLQACSGEISFVGFKGQLRVDNSRGSLFTRAFKLPLTLHKFKGQLNFQQEKGALYLKSMTGSMSGYSKGGEVRGLIYPKQVNIETNTGKIHLNMPHSQAWVQADTWGGRLWVPTYFNRTRTGGMERAQGRLKGKGKRDGRVSLKSQSGSIKVYQSAQ